MTIALTPVMLHVADNFSSKETVHFLKHCYRFVSQDWQHCVREPVSDQGFEQRFREGCMEHLKEWEISQEREMHLGSGLDSASGVAHEVDIIAKHLDFYAVVEMKNRTSFPPEKNDIIVFFAKIIDYVALNPELALKDVCPVFMSTVAFEQSGLAACIGLGVHPVAPGLRPLPLLAMNAKIVSTEIENGLIVSSALIDQFEDYEARVRLLSSDLSETWFSSRCGYQSETTIVMRAVNRLNTTALSRELRQLNADCTTLLNQFKAAKRGTA